MSDSIQLFRFLPARGRTAQSLFMLGWALAMALPCPAGPPNPITAARHGKPAAGQAGESLVPGFPTTPARLTPEYVDAFMRAEADDPNEERMLHACKHPDMAMAVVTYLPRYFSPRLLEPARKLARSEDPAIQAGAISGLISLLDADPETRTFVRGLLLAPNPVVRGRAAEYLCWLGIPADYPFLTQQAGAERDVHARAAMVAAAVAINLRSATFGEGAPATLKPGAGPTETYQQMAEVLVAQPTAATRLAVLARLRNTEPCEPITRFDERLKHGERGAALLRTQGLLAGYHLTNPAPEPRDDATTLPVARTLIAPIRDYFDANRKSYGVLIGTDAAGPYGGTYHVGDDVAWQNDHETVVAIGDGIVRSVELGRKSWGGLVVVEHENPAGGRFCSIYGHLGPLVCVHPGQIVRQGEKLGAVGPSYSHANGGFLAHLHFGIHRSAFRAPDRIGAVIYLATQSGEIVTATVTAVHESRVEIRLADDKPRVVQRSGYWIAGYLTSAEFSAKTHDWVDPQQFIRNFR